MSKQEQRERAPAQKQGGAETATKVGCAFGGVILAPGLIWALLQLTVCAPEHHDPVKYQTDMKRLSNVSCDRARSKQTTLQGLYAQNQADIAIGESAATAKGQVARDYQRMVEAEIGMMPGQGNGWRSILVNKGKNAASENERLKSEISDAEADLTAACNL
jgi:hypothetical protein